MKRVKLSQKKYTNEKRNDKITDTREESKKRENYEERQLEEKNGRRKG